MITLPCIQPSISHCMKKTFPFLICIILLSSFVDNPTSFYNAQSRFPRVKKAIQEKGQYVNELLASKNIDSKDFDIFIRIFKKERQLELWAKNKKSTAFSLVKVYESCSSSGVLGPKRRSGDRQTPEGFYTVDAFNPTSHYNLSFRVSYPNVSDLKFADPINPGDNIFIHGSCLTIGCIPVGDDFIQELYIMAIKAKSSGQEIPVHIFPTKMTDDAYARLKSENSSNSSLLEFWSWLKPGYDYFEKNKSLPIVMVDESTGKYLIK